MKDFNTELENLQTLFESPEDWKLEGDLHMSSPDVVTFIYFINKNSVIAGGIGDFVTHYELLYYLKTGQMQDRDTSEPKIIGDVDIKDVSENNALMGRYWINHNKVSIWDQQLNRWENINIKKVFQKLSRLLNVDFMKYELEITPVSGKDIFEGETIDLQNI